MSVHVDYITCELPDPVGVPINDGRVGKVRQDGTVEWVTPCRLQLEGSHGSSMTIRAIGSESFDPETGELFNRPAEYTDTDVENATFELRALTGLNRKKAGICLSGNPTKFLQGHNLFGVQALAPGHITASPSELLELTMAKAAPVVWPNQPWLPALEEINYAAGEISRIDVAGAMMVDRAEDVLPVLKALEERTWIERRGRGKLEHGTTLLWSVDPGKRAPDWQAVIYAKGPEIAVHRLPEAAYSVPGLVEDTARTIRFEFRLRTGELKRLGLRHVGDWSHSTAQEVHKMFMQRLDFGDEHTVNLDVVDLSRMGLSPRIKALLAAWKAGNDMRLMFNSEATYFRNVKQIKQLTGIDIRTARPTSNVIPLRRAVSLSQATLPQWAARLTAELERAA